jgi:hypothetical protein
MGVFKNCFRTPNMDKLQFFSNIFFYLFISCKFTIYSTIEQ